MYNNPRRFGKKREKGLIFSIGFPNKDAWNWTKFGDPIIAGSWKCIEIGLFGFRFYCVLYCVWEGTTNA